MKPHPLRMFTASFIRQTKETEKCMSDRDWLSYTVIPIWWNVYSSVDHI